MPRFPATRTLSLGLLASFFVDLFFGLVKIMQRKGQRCVHGCIDDRRTQAGPRVFLQFDFTMDVRQHGYVPPPPPPPAKL